jgi:hypothetical protein
MARRWPATPGFIQPAAAGNLGAHGITFADIAGGIVMTLGRFVPILALLALERLGHVSRGEDLVADIAQDDLQGTEDLRFVIAGKNPPAGLRRGEHSVPNVDSGA